MTVACLVGAGRLLWPQPGLDEQPGATERQLTFVRDALDNSSDTAAQELFPEGYVFSNVLYGLAWVQAAHTDSGLRDDALRESRWALARVESDEGRAVFSPRLQPAYGVFWAGWTNWLRGAILSLDHSDTSAVHQFSVHSAEIAQAFSTADTPFLQAYQGQAWPVDSTVAMAHFACTTSCSARSTPLSSTVGWSRPRPDSTPRPDCCRIRFPRPTDR
ncbi:hypothetical protein ACFWPX_15565 [Nocardia sp. NPDC058518]|uniref:hypothetical protein n=1 Tax=Nocardia sp. NPDC058518 TaxID=3346534 RepID=UPI00366131E1